MTEEEKKAGYEFNKSACADAIKRRRKDKNHSQEDMAEMLNVSRNSWQNTENSGSGLDSVSKIFEIASVLECDPYALMHGEIVEVSNNATYKTVAENLKFLNMEDSLNIGEKLIQQMQKLSKKNSP